MEQLLRKSENENNELVSNIFLGLIGFVLLIWLLAMVGLFDVDNEIISVFAITLISLLIIPLVLIRLLKIKSNLMKYILILDIAITVGACYIFFTFQMVIMFLIPVLIALLYLDKRVIWFSEIASMLSLIVSHIISSGFVAMPWLEQFVKLSDIVRYYLLPRSFQLVVCFLIVNLLTGKITNYFTQYEKLNVDSGESDNKDLDEFIELLNNLTESEQKVFLELLHGKTNAQISHDLSLSNGTVKNYVSNIYDKLNCRERSYLILKYSAVLTRYDQSHIK